MSKHLLHPAHPLTLKFTKPLHNELINDLKLNLMLFTVVNPILDLILFIVINLTIDLIMLNVIINLTQTLDPNLTTMYPNLIMCDNLTAMFPNLIFTNVPLTKTLTLDTSLSLITTITMILLILITLIITRIKGIHPYRIPIQVQLYKMRTPIINRIRDTMNHTGQIRQMFSNIHRHMMTTTHAIHNVTNINFLL